MVEFTPDGCRVDPLILRGGENISTSKKGGRRDDVRLLFRKGRPWD